MGQYDTRKITSAFSKHSKPSAALKVPSVLRTSGANKGPVCDNFLQYVPKQSIVLVAGNQAGSANKKTRNSSSQKKAVKKLGDEPVTIEEMRLRLNISTGHHRSNSSASKQNRLGSPILLTERTSDIKTTKSIIGQCENPQGKCVVNSSNFGGCQNCFIETLQKIQTER